MSSTASSSLIDEQSSFPIARITAQEEEYVKPLREYLETNGCLVTVNKESTNDVAYDIVTGDLFFVKDIFSRTTNTGVKRLGIVFNSSLEDAKKIAGKNTKIVVVDPVHLMEQDVVDIFSFFFTAKEITLDKRRNRHEPIEAPVAPFHKIDQPILIKKEATNVLTENDEHRIGHIITDVFGEKNIAHPPVQKPQKKHRRRKVKMSLQVLLTFFLLIIVFPCVWYLASITIVCAIFSGEVQHIKSGNISVAKRLDSVSVYWLSQGRVSLGFVSLPLRLIGLDHTIRGQERFLSFLSDTSSALTETEDVADMARATAKTLLSNSLSNTQGTPAASLNQIRISTESIIESMGLAQAELSTLISDRTFPFFIPFIEQYAKSGEVTLVSLREVLSYIDNLLTLYPHIAGFRGSQTYLVLLQNSSELRATGGFIGSVGLATFEDGVLSDFSIQDVYALDGQLKGHVDPPAPLRELMGEEHWYLRDSNWDPDFKESGARAAWFYEKETGAAVDGVIAINVPVVVSLLRATGPIFLPDYNDRISADNFFGKSFYYTQSGTFAGSTQKSDFLGTLSRALLSEVTNDSAVNPVAVFRALASGLAMRDILFSFTDSDTQQLVEHFGWGGRVFDVNECEGNITGACLFDPFGAFEENVSVNKVNYFVKRTSVRHVTIDPNGKISETVALTIRNTSNLSSQRSTLGMGGTYTSYLRLFMTPDVSVQTVSLDGTPIPSRNPKSKTPPTIPYLETATASAGIEGIGVAVSIPSGEEHTISIALNHLTQIPFVRGVGDLNLLYYKHPGISDENNTTIIDYPASWTVADENQESESVAEFLAPGENASSSFVAKQGELKYNSTILQDQHMHLRITQ